MNKIGIGGFVFLIFLTLKLAQVGVVANWSWWWVFSPILISVLIFIMGVVYVFFFVKKHHISFDDHGRVNRKPKSKFQIRIEEAYKQRQEQIKKSKNNE